MEPLVVFLLQTRLGGEDVLLKEPLTNQVFKVLAEGPAFDSSVSLAIMKTTVFFCSVKRRIIWYRLWELDPV